MLNQHANTPNIMPEDVSTVIVVSMLILAFSSKHQHVSLSEMLA